MSTQTIYNYLDNVTAASSVALTDELVILKGGAVQTSTITVLRTLLEPLFQATITPPGVMTEYGGITTPTGWLLCDGTAYSRSTYADLYGAITSSKGTVTISIASPGVVTLNTHGLATGDNIELTTDGALPTGLSVNTNYYVIYNDANTFWLATTLANALAGTKINTSGSQSGTHTLRYCPYGISTATNFLVPDFREASPYGIGTRGAGVTAHDAKVAGQFSDDQKQGSEVALRGATDNGGSLQGIGNAAARSIICHDSTTGIAYDSQNGAGNYWSQTIANATDGTPRTGTVTRGKILGVKYIIKT